MKERPAVPYGAAEQVLGEGVLDVALDRATERTGAVVFVEALRDEELEGSGRQVDRDVVVGEATAHFRELEVHDALEVFGCADP